MIMYIIMIYGYNSLKYLYIGIYKYVLCVFISIFLFCLLKIILSLNQDFAQLSFTHTYAYTFACPSLSLTHIHTDLLIKDIRPINMNALNYTIHTIEIYLLRFLPSPPPLLL